jgi:hypothetical protein
MREENQPKPQKLFTYHLLRYTPNLVRDEWLNIGVLILDESTGECRLRLVEEPAEYARIFRLQPAADENVLRRLRDHLEDRFEFSLQHRPAAHVAFPVAELNAFLGKLDSTFSTGLQLGPQKGLFGSDIDDELKRLYEEHVGLERRGARVGAPGTRSMMREYCSQVWRHAGLWQKVERSIRVAEFTYPGDPLRVDFAYRHNGTRGFVHLLSVSRSPSAAKEYAYTTQHIAPRAPFKSEFAAVTDVSLESGNLRHQFIRDTLRDARIEPIPLEGFAVWVAKLKPMLQ